MLPASISSTALFVSLVKEGEERSGITLHEEVESYVVFMLMRLIRCSSLFDIPVALLYLESIRKTPYQKALGLEKASDYSLTIAGLFPQQAKRANVSPRYFREMAELGYSTLALLHEQQHKKETARTYGAVAQESENITNVLMCVRQPFL